MLQCSSTSYATLILARISRYAPTRQTAFQASERRNDNERDARASSSPSFANRYRRKIDPFSTPSKRMKRKGKRKDVKHKLHKERTAGQRPLCLVWSCCSELLLVSVAVFGESDHCALFPTCLPSSLRKERRRRGTGLAPEF